MTQSTEQGSRLAVAFDIGGSTTRVGVVSAFGEVLAVEHSPTDVEKVGRTVFLELFFESVGRMVGRIEARPAGIGGTVLGWTDERRSGPFLCWNAPQLHGLDLRRMLVERFGLPVALIDDSNAHLLAEYTYGSGRGCRRFMNLAMGTGLSAAVMIDGKPLQFTGGCAGDTGHLILRPGGPSCSAGCKGCGEALIGVEGIERLAVQAFGEPTSARKVIELARQGEDPRALNVITEIGGYVGELLASLSHIFLPERISLSGGTANAGPVLLRAARERFEFLVGDYHRNYASSAGDYYRGVEIVLAGFRGESGMIGSAVNLFSTLENPNSISGAGPS